MKRLSPRLRYNAPRLPGAYRKGVAAVRTLLGLPGWDSAGRSVQGLWDDDRGDDYRLVVDHEGILRVFESGILPYKGSRQVRNLYIAELHDSDNWRTYGSGAIVDGDTYGELDLTVTVVGSADRIETDASLYPGAGLLVGKDFRVSYEAKTTTANLGKNIICQLNRYDGGASAIANDIAELTDEWQRFTVDSFPNFTDPLNNGMRLQFWGGSNYCPDFTIRNIQLEDVTGQANQNPSEYEPVGTPTGAEICSDPTFQEAEGVTWIDAGTAWTLTEGQAESTTTYITLYAAIDIDVIADEQFVIVAEFTGGLRAKVGGTGTYEDLVSGVPFVNTSGGGTDFIFMQATSLGVVTSFSVKKATDGIGIYNTANGNTVDVNGVVTEAVGAALSPVPVIRHEPESTNKCENYNLNPTDTTGVTKTGDAASVLSVVDDSANYPAVLKQIGNQQVYKLDNSAGVAWAYAVITGGAADTTAHSIFCYARIDTGTGRMEFNKPAGAVNITASTYTLISSENITTHDIGNKVRLAVPAGSTLYFIANQMEDSAFSTSLVEVIGGSAIRNTDANQHPYSSAVFNQDEGYLVFDWTPEYDKVDLSTTDLETFTTDGVGGYILYMDDGGVKTFAGSALGAVNELFVSGNKYRVAVRWGNTEGTYQIGILDIDGDGLWSWDGTPGAYDGEFGASQLFLYIFKDHPYINQVHDLQIFNKDQTTAEIEARHP